MKPILYLTILTTFFACSQRSNKVAETETNPKVQTSVGDEEDERVMNSSINESSPKNSRIIARVVERLESTDTDIEMSAKCQYHPCRARIEFMALTHHGSNFHGQYNEGDTATARFIFTLDSTDYLFPELNESLPGLTEGDFFEAELFENDRGGYSIQIYDKK